MKADDTVSTPLKRKVRVQQGSFTFLRSLGKKCCVSKPGSGTPEPTLETPGKPWVPTGLMWVSTAVCMEMICQFTSAPLLFRNLNKILKKISNTDIKASQNLNARIPLYMERPYLLAQDTLCLHLLSLPAAPPHTKCLGLGNKWSSYLNHKDRHRIPHNSLPRGSFP